MKHLFATLFLSITLTAGFANGLVHAVAYSSDIEIYPSAVSGLLNIDVDENLANGVVTVSIFNSIGEIVLEEVLGLGLNKVDVSSLAKGSYVAVVRENEKYKSKSSFEVI